MTLFPVSGFVHNGINSNIYVVVSTELLKARASNASAAAAADSSPSSTAEQNAAVDLLHRQLDQAQQDINALQVQLKAAELKGTSLLHTAAE